MKHNKIKNAVRRFAIKHGGLIACCAFAFTVLAANSPCTAPYYEPEAPTSLTNLKKFKA